MAKENISEEIIYFEEGDTVKYSAEYYKFFKLNDNHIKRNYGVGKIDELIDGDDNNCVVVDFSNGPIETVDVEWLDKVETN